MKKLCLFITLLTCSVASMACGFPSLNNQVGNYTRFSSSALFGNSAYAALQNGTGLQMASQILGSGSYNSLAVYTPLKQYTLQFSYSEMSQPFAFNNNLSLGLSRSFTFNEVVFSAGVALQGGKGTASFSELEMNERLNFETGWNNFNRFSNQFITTQVATALEYKNLTAMVSVGNILLHTAEIQEIPLMWNAGASYQQEVGVFELTHSLAYNKQAFTYQLIGLTSATYKFLELGLGLQERDQNISGVVMAGLTYRNISCAYNYSKAANQMPMDVTDLQQPAHEVSIAWNLSK